MSFKWKPIDSAPKNGDDILGYCDDYQIVLRWNEYEDDGSSWCTHMFGKMKGWEDFNNENHQPTHWCELPEAPNE